MWQRRLQAIMSGADRSPAGRLARAGLRGLAEGYALAIAARNAVFDRGWRRRHRLPRPAISVGNLTVGGTGKTPVTIELARRLIARGHRPAILLRGYKADDAESDEAALYRQAFRDATPPVAVAADPSRIRGAERALRAVPETDVFLLDDAFQHRQVHRELDLVLIDATRPFGYGHVVPRGLMREPASELERADGVIVTRVDQVSARRRLALDKRLERLSGSAPLAHVRHVWTQVRAGASSYGIETLAGSRVAAACGIGNPAAFERMLTATVGELLWCEALADHARPDRARLTALLEKAAKAGAAALVTTEKDWVKWQRVLRDTALPLPVYRVDLSIEWVDGEGGLDALLAQTLGESHCSASGARLH